ncbi:MAG: iron-containing alcohol dehydrogenase [Bacteroidales bacterium]|nr:iron-containing alcohol dehydrogenase [Bacteroidales bacterium]
MENFTAYNPTKLHFGKNIVETMHTRVGIYGKKALVIYGKESAKKYGFFEKVTNQLTKANIEFVEFGGIKPNPVIDDVNKAVELCKKEQIDFIVAVGGGSVIDSAKIIAIAYANNEDAWEIMKYKVKTTKSTPIIVVLTLAATGTEMNGAAVVQNHETHEKIGYVNELNYPKESFLDPDFTITVSKENTIYGIADMIAHSLESYFAEGEADLSDRLVAANINEIFEAGPELLKNLENYDLRARILWASTVALNGTLYSGRKSSGDWGVHSIGHVMSYLFDTAHGATLSVTFLAWMKHLKPRIEKRLEKLGYLLTGEEKTADETIKIFESFFKKIGAPTVLEELEICRTDMAAIKKYLIHTKASGMHYKLEEDDYDKILRLM